MHTNDKITINNREWQINIPVQHDVWNRSHTFVSVITHGLTEHCISLTQKMDTCYTESVFIRLFTVYVLFIYSISGKLYR